MNRDQFQEWESGMKSRGPIQEQQMQTLLSETGDVTVSLETLEARLAEHRRCPHCNTPGAISRGTPRGLRRYRCKGCKKTFNAATNTILEGLNSKNRWLMFREALADGLSVRATAKRCNLSVRTAFRWYQRLQGLKEQPSLKSGSIEKTGKKVTPGKYATPVSKPEPSPEISSEPSPGMTKIEIIRKIVSQHLNTGILSILIDKPEFPCSFDDLKTALSAISKSSGPSTPLGIILMAILEDLRAKNLTSACTNNGPRHVPSMEAWNAWVKDGNKSRNLSREALYRAPAFMALQYCVSTWIKNLSIEDLSIEDPDNTETLCNENDCNRILDEIRENTVSVLAGLNVEMNFTPDRHDQCILTGHRLNYGTDPLAPCLMELGKTLPRLKTPLLIRHMMLDLPSEELIAGQFSSMRGFEKGLRTLAGIDTGTIINAMNHAMGYDVQMMKCIKQTGIAALRCDNMPGTRFLSLQEYIWCAGYSTGMSQIRTSPGIMYFADPETLIDVVMKSELHERRSSAMREMEACLEHPDRGMNCLPMPDVKILDVYAPSGYSIMQRNGLRNFSTEEFSIEPNEYPCGLFSTIPLDIPEEIISREPWRHCA